MFNGFAILGGDILYPEEGSNPWENSKTIYLEIPTFEFKFKVINKIQGREMVKLDLQVKARLENLSEISL